MITECTKAKGEITCTSPWQSPTSESNTVAKTAFPVLCYTNCLLHPIVDQIVF